VRVEREALKLAVQWPGLCGPDFGGLGADAFTAPVHAAVYGLIAAGGGTANAGRDRDWVAGLLDAAPDDRARSFVNQLAVEPLLLNGEPDEKYADEVAARVADLAARRQIAELKTRLQRVDYGADPDAYNQLSAELMMLEIRRKSQVDRATDL
jgi:DNA primase